MLETTAISRRDLIAGSATLASWVSFTSSAGAATRGSVVRMGLIGCPPDTADAVLSRRVTALDQLRLAVTHVWDVSRDRAAQYAQKHLIANVADRYDRMAGKVDGVLVSDSRYTAWHPQLLQPYLKAGTPVWVDGPLAYSVAKAQQIVEFARQTKTPLAAASPEEFLPLTRHVARRVSEIAPLTAGMAVVSTRGRPEGKWAGAAALNVGAAIFGVKARRVGRIVASTEETNYAVTLEYAEIENKGRPLHVVVQGMPVATDRLWVRLYGNDMVDRGHVFMNDAEDDWLNAFLPAALAAERMFAARIAPQPHDYLLAKTRLYVAACKSSLDAEGRQVEVAQLEAGWEAGNPYTGLFPEGYFP